MILAISGTPCTGKTAISKKVAERLGWKLISVNDLAKELNAYLGEDKKRKAMILDMKKIVSHIKKIKSNVIVEGHAAHEIPSNVVVVLRCNPDVLEKRLKERYPDKPDKIKENVDAEILGVITSEAVATNDNVFEVDTTNRSIDENVVDIMSILDGAHGYEVGGIDWLDKYEKKLLK